MKFFAFVMALLVIGLSGMPCADSSYTANYEKAKTEISKAPLQHDDANHPDDCSPFCQCSCCAGFSINHSLASISRPCVFGNRFLASYLHANLIEISLPIWEPPQLS